MKKGLIRFITILILIVTFIEIILPMNVYAEEEEEQEERYYLDNYELIELEYNVNLDTLPEDATGSWVKVVLHGGTPLKENDVIYYEGEGQFEKRIDENGKEYYVFVGEGKKMFATSEGESVYLQKGVYYLVPLGSAALEVDIFKNDSNPNPEPGKEYNPEDAVQSGALNEIIVDETGWYLELNVKSLKGVFYYQSGEVKYPTYVPTQNKNPGGTVEKIYLVRGNVYYSSEVLSLVKEPLALVELLKQMIANISYSLANGLHYLVGVALGETVTIDDIVFNNYSEINISYFDKKEEVGDNASSLLYGTEGVGGLDSVVNEWYAIFMRIALMGYMVIFVYMGIRILLISTANQKATYKKLFVDWVIGLAILFLFPFVMKYIIYMNEGFVEMIEANKGYNSEDIKSSPLENMDYEKNPEDIYIDREIRWAEGNDYMSKIAYAAYYTEEPAISIAFFIMTWQLITLIFHYYKRLFMVGFLIVIFPLVAFSYAIDKIADGKSQAFNTWVKEFLLNVFAQTFHAIVYVFVCATIYSAGGLDVTGTTNVGGIGVDSILIMVGVTFLFKGEEIIRQIFGQISSAGTMRNLGDSAAATFAKFKLAEGAIKGVADFTIGEKSIPRKLYKGRQKIKMWNARLKAFDKTATIPEEYNPGMRLEHAPENPGKDATDEQKQNFLQERALFNAAAVLNNPNSHSKQEQARALNALKGLAAQNPDHDVFKDTLMTAGQIAAMGNLDTDVEGMIASGMSRLDIEREVTLRLGVIFSNESEERREDIRNTYYTAMFLEGTNNSVSRSKIKREVDEIIGESNRIRNSLAFGTNRGEIDTIETEVAGDAYDMFNRYGGEGASEEEGDITKTFAINLARLRQRGSGAYTEKELLDIANHVREHADDNEATRQMLEEELDTDIDIFMHTLADTVVKESKSEEAVKIAKAELDYYENNTGDGYFYDEVPVHEVLKEKNNLEILDTILEGIFQNKKDSMKEATEELAKEYLAENKVDIMEGSYDTTVRTQDGYTREELEALKRDAIAQTLRDIAAIGSTHASGNSASVGFGDESVREYLRRKDEERTGINPIEENEGRSLWGRFSDALDGYNMTTSEYIEKRRKEREDIERAHFYGDIGDRK